MSQYEALASLLGLCATAVASMALVVAFVALRRRPAPIVTPEPPADKQSDKAFAAKGPACGYIDITLVSGWKVRLSYDEANELHEQLDELFRPRKDGYRPTDELFARSNDRHRPSESFMVHAPSTPTWVGTPDQNQPRPGPPEITC